MKFFGFLFFFFVINGLFANQINEMANSNVVFVDEINLKELKPNQLAISMPFAKELILNPEQKKALEEKAILKIELVYTKYRTSSTFNQKALNKKRLIELKALTPFLFEFPLWNFELISQTNGESRTECGQMFHGFIFTFRPNSSKKTLDKEAAYLERLMSQMTTTDSIKSGTNKLELVADIKTRWDDRIGYVHDTIWKEEEPIPPPDFFYDHTLYKDSTVLNSFSRNKNWNNFIVVTDVTGSMSPYIAQVFVWLKEQAQNKKAKAFVFFNDGDDKPSRKKRPLETGGVYLINNGTIDSVMAMAALCMRSGSGGGESMENDIEAMMDAEKQYPKTSEIILVADNKETMRDHKYLEKVKRPVHVILCGADHRVNIQYLNLARKTKGSIHTKEEDVFNLHEIKKGEHIFIQGHEYLFEQNQFHFIYK